jgi:ABC-type multidrug transport system ATPase subunit
VKVKKGNKEILKGISGVVRPSRLTAVIGSTGTLLRALGSSHFVLGAGKSTFIDILAGRNKTGKVGGTVLLKGAPPSHVFNKVGAYVLQQDLLMV